MLLLELGYMANCSLQHRRYCSPAVTARDNQSFTQCAGIQDELYGALPYSCSSYANVGCNLDTVRGIGSGLICAECYGQIGMVCPSVRQWIVKYG